jgi:2-dehydro-3-deoxygluconokinase
MDVITLGETMILLTPKSIGPLDTVYEFHKGLAGAESNVAIGLSRLGHQVAWISKLGSDSFGRFIYKTLRGEGIDVSHVIFDETRPTGVFFKEFMGDGRTNTLYYRKDSAASSLEPQDIPLSKYSDAKYLLITGITPALSEGNRNTVFQVIEQAHTLGIQVVFDPNIRHKLWPISESQPVLQRIASLSDIVLPGLQEGAILTGEETVEGIADAFIQNGANTVVIKLGPKGAYYQTPSEKGNVPAFPVRVINEVGAGDAFTAGFLSGMLDRLPLHDAVRRACALGALAVTGIGDYECLPSRSDLEDFISGIAKPER